ncbi:MAG: hypothetical protein V1906_00165 [Candidatus Woesearchaeota archaeon]
MRKALIFIAMLFVASQLCLAGAATYDERALSKFYKIAKNEDGSITLSKMAGGNYYEFGKLEGQVTVKDDLVYVKSGRFIAFSNYNYILAKGSFKIDPKANDILVGFIEGSYAESNYYRMSCATKDCEIRLSYGKPKSSWATVGKDFQKDAAWMELASGTAALGPATAGVEKEVVDFTAKLKKEKPAWYGLRYNGKKDMIPFTINVSSIILMMPFDAAAYDEFNVFRTGIEGYDGKDIAERDYYAMIEKSKTKFGWLLVLRDYVRISVSYFEPNDKVPISLDIYAYDHLIVRHSQFESSLDTNLVSFTNEGKTVLFSGMHGLLSIDKSANEKYNAALFLNSLKAYERCRGEYSRWSMATCIYFDMQSQTLRISDKPKSSNIVSIYPSSGIMAENMMVKKIVMDPLPENGNYRILDKGYKGKWMDVRRDSLKFENTNDWKDIGVSFVAFIYNPKLRNFDKMDCDIDIGKCTLNGIEIYKARSALSCKEDNDCKSENMKCLVGKCVSGKMCKPIFENSKGKINLLFVGRGYESEAAIISDAKKLMGLAPGSRGMFTFSPFDKYKEYFNAYYADVALSRFKTAQLGPNGESALTDHPFRLNLNDAKKYCSSANVVVLMDKLSSANDGYNPFSSFDGIALPMKESNYLPAMPGILAHEFGHNFGLLLDEYYDSDSDMPAPAPIRYLTPNLNERFGVNAVNCVPCSDGKNAGWVSCDRNKQFFACGANCRPCKLWCRPSENSLMNNNWEKESWFTFNEPSRIQLDFFLKKMLKLPEDKDDLKFKEWLSYSRYGTKEGRCPKN